MGREKAARGAPTGVHNRLRYGFEATLSVQYSLLESHSAYVCNLLQLQQLDHSNQSQA
jgi:hypothetical protein